MNIDYWKKVAGIFSIGFISGIIFIIAFGVMISSGKEEKPKTKIIYKDKIIYKTKTKEKEKNKSKEKNMTSSTVSNHKETYIPEKKDKKKHKKVKKTYIFGAGNYKSGKNFTPGTYDIVAISGSGNVMSNNMFDGGINAIMSPKTGGLVNAEKQYKNIELPSGTKLEIMRVKVKLIRK